MAACPFASLDSADEWAHPHRSKRYGTGHPTARSGVPPVYFSATGQLRGHPAYDWSTRQQGGYGWWSDRMRMVEFTPIDRFRGLAAY